jgi:hypothetical protein
VKPEFTNSQSNSSAIADPPVVMGKKTAKQSKATPPAANAILIRGFWRENPRSQNIVSDLLKRLRENSNNSSFSFTAKGKNGDTVALTDEQIIKKLSTSPNKEGDLAFSFELTLPLARPVVVK